MGSHGATWGSRGGHVGGHVGVVARACPSVVAWLIGGVGSSCASPPVRAARCDRAGSCRGCWGRNARRCGPVG
eukprot:2308221-Prymnesium_polylepis.1